MALLSDTANSLPKSFIEFAHSVKPTKATDMKLSRPVKISNPISSGVLQRHINVILYYDCKAAGEDSVKLLAGWIIESLGKALEDRPIFAGRLRQGKEGEVEIVPNDSGVRLLEAWISRNVEEYLDSDEKEDVEAELVCWNDFDEENLEYTPLFYVQVTKFLCGGCSIGISCSLLLADPLTFMSFLRKWSTIHNNIVSVTRPPIFYVPNLNPKDNTSLFKQVGSQSLRNREKTTIFKRNLRFGDDKNETLQYIEDAEEHFGVKSPPTAYFVVKESTEGVEVEKLSREVISVKPLSYGSEVITCGRIWEEIEPREVSFFGGNYKPCGVSYWTSSVSSQGLVMLIPSPDEFNIVVAIP